MYWSILVVSLVTVCVCGTHGKYFIPVSGAKNRIELPLNFSGATDYQCRRDVELLRADLENNTLWAYRMWDASARTSLGLTEGSSYQLGNFEECLSIEQPFRAQYCLAAVHMKIKLTTPIDDPFSLQYKPYDSVYNKLYSTRDPNKVHRDIVHWGLCMPASCSARDIQNALQTYLDNETNPHIDRYEVQINDTDCQLKDQDRNVDRWDIIFCILVFLLVIFVIICTLFDVQYLSENNNESLKKNKCIRALMCFSAKQNIDELDKPDSSNEALNVLYGVKVFLTYSITLGHNIVNTLTGAIFNYEDIEQVNRSTLAMGVCRGEVAVDLFFLLSGLLGTYSYLSQSEKKHVNPFRSIILRYFRLVPVFAIMSFFYATIFYKLGSGPLWKTIIGAEKNYCQKTWWTNLLLINNYVDSENGVTYYVEIMYLNFQCLPPCHPKCMLQGWYLAADFQLFIMSVLLNMLIKRNNKKCWTMLSFIFLISIVIPFCITFIGQKDPVYFIYNNIFYTLRQNDVFKNMYIPAHTRASPYIIGMALGHIYYQYKDSKYKMPKLQSMTLTSIASVACAACVFGGVVFFNPYVPYSILQASFYAAFHRPAFAFGAALIFFALSYGTVPIFQEIFCWKPLIPLAKLSFSVYMTHMAIQLARVGSMKAPETVTVISWFSDTAVDLTFATLFSLALYLLVESPFWKLMKQLIPNDTCNSRTKPALSPSVEDITRNEI